MKIKPSQVYNLALAVKNLTVLLVISIVCFKGLKYLPSNTVVLDIVYYIPFVVSLVVTKNIGWGILKIYCTSYEISESQLIITNGVFHRKTELLEIFRIKDISIDEPFIYRLFSKGNIIVLSSDGSTPSLILECIDGFQKISKDLSVSVDEQRKLKGVREFD